MRIRGRPSAVLALIGLASLGACGQSSTAVAVTQDIATSLSITMNGGSQGSSQLVMELGDTTTLTAVATNPLGLAVPTGTVMWSSTNTTVATIDGSGLVTAVGIGSAEIRAASGEAVSSIPTVVNDSASFPAPTSGP